MVAQHVKAWVGGKSELQRARRSVIRSPGNGKESATERETTSVLLGERVKRCPVRGLSRGRQEVRAHQCTGRLVQLGKPRLEQGQIGSALRGAPPNLRVRRGGGTGKVAGPWT